MKEKEDIRFETVHHHGAGIDTGSRDICVLTDGEKCESFKTFTEDYERCCRYLKSQGITPVASMATGVYRMSLYDMPEQNGIHVCPVHPREVRQVKGRKNDVSDVCWIQNCIRRACFGKAL